MSQAGIISFESSPVIATSYVTDAGTAIPAGNILNILGNDSTLNSETGIVTIGVGNTVSVFLTNRLLGHVTTIGALTSDIITFNLGETPGTYIFQFMISAFDAVTPAGLGYSITATAKTNGAVATVIGVPLEQVNEDAALVPCDFSFNAVGNTVVLDVTGTAGLTIRWNSTGLYTFAS